jgi:hypothetical protein
MALTAAKDVYRAAFEPLPGSVYHTRFPYCYRAAGGAHDPAACTCDWEAELDLLFHQMVDPERVAAVIVEPVLGEGGYIVPPPTFLPRLRELQKRLVADDIRVIHVTTAGPMGLAGRYLGHLTGLPLVGSFQFITDSKHEPYQFHKAVEVAARVYARRKRSWTGLDESLLLWAAETATAAEFREFPRAEV